MSAVDLWLRDVQRRAWPLTAALLTRRHLYSPNLPQQRLLIPSTGVDDDDGCCPTVGLGGRVGSHHPQMKTPAAIGVARGRGTEKSVCKSPEIRSVHGQHTTRWP